MQRPQHTFETSATYVFFAFSIRIIFLRYTYIEAPANVCCERCILLLLSGKLLSRQAGSKMLHFPFGLEGQTVAFYVGYGQLIFRVCA